MTSIQSQKNWLTASRSTKKIFPPISKWEKLVNSYFETDKHCCNYLEREKSDYLLFGVKKCRSQMLGARKKIMTSI